MHPYVKKEFCIAYIEGAFSFWKDFWSTCKENMNLKLFDARVNFLKLVIISFHGVQKDI